MEKRWNSTRMVRNKTGKANGMGGQGGFGELHGGKKRKYRNGMRKIGRNEGMGWDTDK